ncbi:MAG: phosphoribosylglycinamide formyltransferase 2, partial [Bacteroidota bacterium]
VKGQSKNISYSGLEKALSEPDTQLRLFGKPEVNVERRMGVCLAKASSIEDARKKANAMAAKVNYQLQ